jgi:DinB superfamily
MTSPSTQQPKEPDDLEKVRAAQGEGWQWPRIQNEPCPQCGYNPSSLSPSSLGDLAVEQAAAWREFLVQSDDAYLRTNPEADIYIFSPLQYGAHVRDILRVYGDRMALGVEEDSPTVPMFNPAQEVFDSYNQLAPEELGADIEAQARRLADLVENMDPSSWPRIVINDRGIYGVYTFTVAGLACNAVHEAYHHLLDAKGTLSPSAAS